LKANTKSTLAQCRWGILLLLPVFFSWYLGLQHVGTDIHQGEVYRILYLHVPACLTAFMCAFYLLVVSIIGLRSGKESSLYWGRAAAELGLLFTVLGLVTGSIWGRVTWGVWWTWDARILTTFILGVLYAAYLFLQASLPQGRNRIIASSVLGCLIFVDIPIIYKSVVWWRTLHQRSSIAAGTMSTEISQVLYFAIGAMLLLMTWMWLARVENIQMQAKIKAFARRLT